MIDSLLLLDRGNVDRHGTLGAVIIEKHYRSFDSTTTPAIVELFWSHVTRTLSADPPPSSPDVVPIISASDASHIVHVSRDGIYLLAVVSQEVDPLSVVEFLNQTADLLRSYFGSLSPTLIKDNFVIVYEVFEELLDYGQPYITEPNILKDMIPPPSLLNTVINAVSLGTAFGSKAPTGALSQVPWRTSGIKYTQNEIFFDVNERIDVIVDRFGKIVSGRINGDVDCSSKLSGMPDLTLTFGNSRMFEDGMCSFHPCVRQSRYERDRQLSFIPPDGDFTLVTYSMSITNSQSLPIAVKPSFQIRKSGGRLTITLQPRSTGGKPLESVVISTALPQFISSAKLDSTTPGSIYFDPNTKRLVWSIAKILPDGSSPQLSGILYLDSAHDPSDKPLPLLAIQVGFKVSMFTASGLRIDSLQVLNEPYKPYKGVRAFTNAGKYSVRI